jgi:hypothetical protein
MLLSMGSAKKCEITEGGFGTMGREEIDARLRGERYMYDTIVKSLNKRPTKNQIKQRIDALKLAEDVILALEPLLGRGNLWAPAKIPEHLRDMRLNATLGMLREAKHFISKLRISGTPYNFVLGHAADALYRLLKERGEASWARVATELQNCFPEARSDDPDKEREPRLWAYRLAKRYRANFKSSPGIMKAFIPIIWGEFFESSQKIRENHALSRALQKLGFPRVNGQPSKSS